MANKKIEPIAENKLEDSIYKQSKVFYIKVTLASITLFFLALVLFLPLTKIIEDNIKSALVSSPKCKITYKSLTSSYFLPQLNIIKPVIPKGCMGKRKITLSRIKVKLIRPSFFPFGIKTNITLFNGSESLTIESIIGIGKQVFYLNEKSISSTLINLLLPESYSVQGKYAIQAVLTKENAKKFTGSLVLSSKNFQLNSFTVSGLDLPDLNFNKLNLKLSLKDRKLVLDHLIIGDGQAQISGKLQGNALLNLIDPNYTRINFEGSVHFSKSFRDAFSILNILLNGKQEKNGRYFFTLKGTVKNPQPSF